MFPDCFVATLAAVKWVMWDTWQLLAGVRDSDPLCPVASGWGDSGSSSSFPNEEREALLLNIQWQRSRKLWARPRESAIY